MKASNSPFMVAIPGEGLEPLQTEQDEGEEIRDERARTMVSELVLEHQAVLTLLTEAIEFERNGYQPVEHAQGDRTGDFR